MLKSKDRSQKVLRKFGGSGGSAYLCPRLAAHHSAAAMIMEETKIIAEALRELGECTALAAQLAKNIIYLQGSGRPAPMGDRMTRFLHDALKSFLQDAQTLRCTADTLNYTLASHAQI